MKYPFEKQKDLKDCGVNCLLMLIRYYGGGISKEYLREITNTTKSGVTAFNLIEGAKKIGFEAYGVKGDIEDLENQNCPCIAHVIYKKSFQHFIVIYKVDKLKKRLLIADPNNNHLNKISFEEFKNISTNIYIMLKPNKKIMYVDENSHLKKEILAYIKNNLNLFIKVLLISLLITFSQIFLSFEFKFLLEYVINYQSVHNLIFLSLIFFIFLIIKEISDFRRNRLVNILNHNLDKHLLPNVYNHILSLPYLYYKNRTTGEIISRMNDLTNVRDVFSKFIVSLLIDMLMMLGSILILLTLSFKLAFISILTILLIVILTILFNDILEEKISNLKETAAFTNSYLVETISGIETIKNQNITDYISNKFLLKYSKFNKNSLKLNNTLLALSFIKNILIGISNLLILTLGSYLIIKNSLSISTLIAYMTLSNYIFTPIDNFINLILSLKEAKISFSRIKDLYEVKEEKNEETSRILNGKIQSNHLSFSYNGCDQFLKDINISIEPGEKILIHGRSGSGKSTFAKLLNGNLKLSNKKLFIDERDINRYKLADLRKNICYISNNEMLFTDTISNNILIDKKDDEFDEIVKICMVDEFVENKNLAYDLLIEENGFNLSGGQKQRIALARSLLNNANIFILDEALNQVDVERERKILSNIFTKYKNKTFIYISHRFNNSDLFDKKYKIEDGVSYEETI